MKNNERLFRFLLAILILAGVSCERHPQSKSIDELTAIKNDSLKTQEIYKIALMQFEVFNYKEAIVLFDSAMNLARKQNNYIVVANCLNELGLIEGDLNNMERSRNYLYTALEIAKKYTLEIQRGVTLGNLANLSSNPDTAMKLKLNAVDILKNAKGAKKEYCSALANLANSLANKEEAIALYYESIGIAEKSNFYEILIGAYNNLGCTYLEMNNLTQAESCLRDHAIPLALKTKNTDWLSTVYESCAEVLEKKGDYRQAYVYQKKALASRMEASQKQAAHQLRLLNELLMARNREVEIREKTFEIQVQQDQLNRVYIWLVILALSVIVITVTALLLIQRKNLKLRKREVEIAKRINEIEEKDQERISMQLHDAIRPLSAVFIQQIGKMNIPDHKMKADIVSKLSEATQEVRQLSHRLNPVMRQQMTFKELTRSLRKDFQGSTGLTIKLALPEKEPRMPKDTANQLYFMIQEMLMNADKHVKNGTVEISISEELGNIYVFYADDGVGFNPALVKLSGLGLMHIFERAKLLDGKAVLDSAPGKGTRWVISVPAEIKSIS